eukprot:m.16906 g.16906  ORF g.16906 m.16906 type:complete len:141 (-) comp5835_c0_seq2:89-511(-)
MGELHVHKVNMGLKMLETMMYELDLHGRLYIETPTVSLSRLIYAHHLQPVLNTFVVGNVPKNVDLKHVCAVAAPAGQIYEMVPKSPQIPFFTWFGNSKLPGSLKFWACQDNVHVILAFPSSKSNNSSEWGWWNGIECDKS